MNPIQRTWQLTEAPFNPGKLHHTETIFTVGNGYMGVRATFEEGYPGELISTLVHGIFDHAAGELVPELVVLPNPLALTISVDGDVFSMKAGKILGYRATLDLKVACLTRRVLWQSPKGVIVALSFERFASLEREHLLIQRITARPLNADCTVVIRGWIDGTVANMDGDRAVDHWDKQTSSVENDSIALYSVARQSGYGVSAASRFSNSKGVDVVLDQSDLRRPAAIMTMALAKDELAEVYRYTAIHTTRDGIDPLNASFSAARDAAKVGYEALYAEHVAEWAKYWHNSDVVIDGDELAQRALRFCTYQILIAAPRHDERVSIGAKTLSGPGYKGHAFWDTELFIVPLLTVTQPKLARNLLMYRYHTIQGARNKAKEAGFEGAMYPWEATDTGEETTPRWTNPLPDGSRIRIWTGDNEQHISTDITFAMMQYWRWTGDDEFFVNYGAEIVLDTAVFWGSRAEWKEESQRYELSQQIGPDEYHENINNSVFTNSMVRWHLHTAIDALEWLREKYPQRAAALTERLKLTEDRLSKWVDIFKKMYIPTDTQRGILEQFDGFFKLEPLNLSYWTPKVSNIDSIIGHEEIQKVAVIKQADVVMMMALAPQLVGDDAALLRNWEYYAPIVDHGSSLSPSMHAWAAARIGLLEEAYDLFMHGATIDLEDNKGNVRDGIHAAAAGGLWQAVVFGFAGIQIFDDGSDFAIDPQLPRYWRSVQFRLFHRGHQRTVTLTNQDPVKA